MAFIIKTVDKAQVNFNQSFIFTINASFSGITGEINPGQIVDIIPDYIDFTLPPAIPPIKSISTGPDPGGTKITFDLGRIEDTGIAIVIKFSCKFREGMSKNYDIFSNTAQLLQNEEVILTSDPVDVQLVVQPDWRISKSIVAPVIDPTPGEGAYYLIELRNFGDTGLSLDATITDIVPSGTTFDPSFIPIGRDWSGIDPSANQNGDISALPQIKWTLNNYTGTYYAMIFKVIIDSNLSVGDIITNTVSWEIDGEPKPDFVLNTVIANAQFGSAIRKYGPQSSEPGALITYELYGSNVGNEPLSNLVLVDNIRPEVFITEVFPGNFGIKGTSQSPALTFNLSYSIDQGATYSLLGTYQYGGNPFWGYITLSDFTTQKVTNLKWEFPLGDIGFIPFNPPRLNGFVDQFTTAIQTVNTITLEATELPDPVIDTVTTLLNGVSYITGAKTNMPGGSVFPGSIIRYEATFNGTKSKIENPVVTDLLPAEVEYAGNLKYSYREYFEDNKTYTSDNNPLFFPTPTVQITPNFNSTGRDLLRIIFQPFLITQKSFFNVSFDVKVKPGAIDEFTNTFVLGNIGETFVENGVLDILDLDSDQIRNETLLETNKVTNNVLFQTSIASDKKVKGSLDTEYTEEPNIGKTIEGGNADYKITLTNTGNSVINQFQIVDILPHVGDTGVILVDTPRLSEFAVYLGDIIQVVLEPQFPDDPVPQLILEYSDSYDPVRFDKTGTGTIGTVDNWTVAPPANITEGKSFRLTSVNTPLKPGQSIIINISGIVPIGTVPGEVAWNSFALKASYINQSGQIENLLPVEPEKVGIEVMPVTSGKVKIGDFVWFDNNKNGIYEPELGETGANGVIVQLYASDRKTLLDETTTANNTHNQPGYYLFNNLDPGLYYVRFIPLSGYEITTQNPLGSQPDRFTGFTPIITTVVDAGSQDLSVDAGIFLTPTTATVGDTVWYDNNRNGVIDGGESGVPGVKVELYACGTTENPRYSAITNADGKYFITNVLPGSYYAKFTQIPVNYEFVTAGNYVNANGVSSCFTVEAGQSYLQADAPIAMKFGTVNGYVWCDVNQNCVMDSGEYGFSDIVVTAYSCTDPKLSYTTVTDSCGYYSINDMIPGLYRIAFSHIPNDVGFIPTCKEVTKTGVTPSCVNVTSNQSTKIDAPVNCCPQKKYVRQIDSLQTLKSAVQKICVGSFANFGKQLFHVGDGVRYYNNSKTIQLEPNATYLLTFSGNLLVHPDLVDHNVLAFVLNSRQIPGSVISQTKGDCEYSSFSGSIIINTPDYNCSILQLQNSSGFVAGIKNLSVSVVKL